MDMDMGRGRGMGGDRGGRREEVGMAGIISFH